LPNPMGNGEVTDLSPGRVVQNVPDINGVHLPPQAFVSGIDANGPSISAEARMQIDAIFPSKIRDVLGR